MRFDFVPHRIDGIEQNPETGSRWALLAHEGKRIMQFSLERRYIGSVREGELVRYPARQSLGLPARFFTCLSQSGIRRVREQGGTVEDLLSPHFSRDGWLVTNPVPLPGGRAVILTRGQRPLWDHSRDEICVLDLIRKTIRVQTKGQQAWYVAAGYLLVAQSGGPLIAAPFDVTQRELTGEAVKVLDGVAALGTTWGHVSLKVADDGALLYVTRAVLEEDELVVLDRNGTRQRTITGWGGYILSGSLSSDGKRIVVSAHRDFGTPNIWLRDLSAAQPVRISYGDFLDYAPQFMLDDRSVAYVSPREGNNRDLYANAVSAGTEERILPDRPGDIRNPCFASGGWIIFSESDSTGQNDVIAHQLRKGVTITSQFTGKQTFP